MSRICRECRKGELKILGLGPYEDTIEVECQNPECGESYEIEMDGFGEGCLEAEQAFEIEQKRRQEDKEDSNG